MLFKLSLKNIKKSFKDYAIYFFTLILGVAVFYVFNALSSQTIMLNVSQSTHELIELMNQVLSGVSIFVSFILGFLIIYASSFLIKRRKKEFGIYMTLGMGKSKISKILLFETIFIGIISLGVGLLFGVGLSQLMSILVANMFEADMTNFTFVFSSSAMIKTMIYFGIMYLLVMIFNTFSVNRCKLIDLIHASKKTETIKMKNPVLCILVFIISCIVLGIAYYNVTAGINELAEFQDVIFQMVLGAVGTFFIFWSLSGLILRIIMSIKKVYLKGLNSFILRQVNSKINTTVFSMTVICLMLFMTICILSSALSIKNSMTSNLKTLLPVDIEVYKPLFASGDYKDDTAREVLNKFNYDVNNNLKDIVELTTYQEPNLTFKTSLGTTLDKTLKENPYLTDNQEEIIGLSAYNKLAKLYNNETYELKDDEYIIIADFDMMIKIRNRSLQENTKLHINGKDYKPKYNKCQTGFIDISSNHINMGIIIVPDSAISNLSPLKSYLMANYNGETKEEKQVIENKIIELDKHPEIRNSYLDASTKISFYEASIGLSAMATFIGLYLGVIFLISSAAILALKELSESTDNKERYTVLRRLGADEKMLNRALFSQIAIFFSLPLLLAIIHSIFGIQVCNTILQTLGNEKLLTSIVMTAIFLIVIYGGYFLITYYCSKNIISDKN